MTLPATTPVFIAIGAAFWLGFALVVNLFGDLMFDRGAIHVIAFLAAPPIVFAALWIVARLTATPLGEMTVPAAIMTAAATILDGAAITLAPGLYGGVGPALAPGAAWILWGGGWGLAVALLLRARA